MNAMNTTEALLQMAPTDSLLRALLTGAPGGAMGELERRLTRGHGPSPVDVLCRDLFAAGGKRLRALVALYLAGALDVPSESALRIAEAIELTHGATLLHDDVIDEADTRRSRPAARRRFSNTLSVLGGDYLLLRSLDTVESLGVPALTAAHRRAVDALLGAEVAQHLSRHQGDLGTESYLAIAAGKTGALFAFACGAPALLAGDGALSEGLWRWGERFGLAFQVADDLRDLWHADSTKPGGLDLEGGVMSLPLRLAAQADPALAAELRARLGVGRSDNGVEALGLHAMLPMTGAVRAKAAAHSTDEERNGPRRVGGPSHRLLSDGALVAHVAGFPEDLERVLGRVRASTGPREAARIGLEQLALGAEAGAEALRGLRLEAGLLGQLHHWLGEELEGFLS